MWDLIESSPQLPPNRHSKLPQHFVAVVLPWNAVSLSGTLSQDSSADTAASLAACKSDIWLKSTPAQYQILKSDTLDSKSQIQRLNFNDCTETCFCSRRLECLMSLSKPNSKELNDHGQALSTFLENLASTGDTVKCAKNNCTMDFSTHRVPIADL